MRRVHDGDWSPRSRDPPSHSQSAYSHPPGALPSSYGDYFNSNLPAVGDLGPLQQYIDFDHDSYDEANLRNFSHFTNSVAEDSGNWLQTPQIHAEYNEAITRSMTELPVTIQTGGETAGPQQELPGTFEVHTICTMASNTEKADIHCGINAKLTDSSRRVGRLTVWNLSGSLSEF